MIFRNRPLLLKRAVADVCRQTFSDWHLASIHRPDWGAAQFLGEVVVVARGREGAAGLSGLSTVVSLVGTGSVGQVTVAAGLRRRLITGAGWLRCGSGVM